MKKIKEKLIVYLLTFLLVFYNLCSFNIKVNAENGGLIHVNGDNIVYKETVSVPETDFTYEPIAGNYKYYVDDPSGIPTGGEYYFFKYGENNKFGAISRSQVAILILNRGLGLVMADDKLSVFLNAYFTASFNFECGGLYSGNNRLGTCLNDISGCVYENYPQNTDINIPSAEVNNIYNYYKYYITVVSPETPDYINIETKKNFEAYQLIDISNQYRNSYNSILSQVGNKLVIGFRWNSNSSNRDFYQGTTTNKGVNTYDISSSTLYGTSGYNNFCSAFSLVNNGDKVTYHDMILNSNALLQVYAVNTTNGDILSEYDEYSAKNDGTYTLTHKTYVNMLFNIYNGYQHIPCTVDGRVICIYKNSNIISQVTNKTYSPSTFNSTTYNNYNTNSDNSISTNTNVVNNSSNTNSTVYNDASESFTEYYSNEENYNIDNSVVINQTTEIINNYYGNGDSPDPNPNPNPDDDDPIWDALLKAIVDFFKKIGQLIAALLTGILELLNTVLDAFANINNSFEGIKNFLSSIFSWFPSEIVSLMVIGLGLALLASFITWFKR